jgi:hypothetical protein
MEMSMVQYATIRMMVLTSVKNQYSGKRLRHLHAFEKMPSKDFRADGAGLIVMIAKA